MGETRSGSEWGVVEEEKCRPDVRTSRIRLGVIKEVNGRSRLEEYVFRNRQSE